MTGVEQARVVLGNRLREFRKAACLSGVDLARQAGWVPSKVSKIERGQQTPTASDLATWCEITDCALALPDLLATLTNLESMWAEWKRVAASGHAQRQRRSIELEAATHTIRNWSQLIVPGLLQTEDYARAVLSTCISFLGTRDDLDDAVAARLRRQNVLHSGKRRTIILLAEQALYTSVGDDQVMIGQLEHLLEVMTLPRLILGVVPREFEFIYTTTSFAMFDRRLAMVETVSAELSVTGPTELSYYEKAWVALHRQALYGYRARERIRAALDPCRGTQ
ncbi:helix-turn-helix transcriptional regulator [Nocardia sp. NBC_00508]|uniref:helix-turn-helix domain-containing protein n=1 Tax=Nocardia sp. NBC_00508 TaxID=2975992 RepID=UPI002E80A33C|nr:helix-turn-helix transcriptional regulator [Nocardia sp. NBC_00508]WUD65593.1 helix-turn-helix transcriptional regulator [Nocardia sp. NBC_00508]